MCKDCKKEPYYITTAIAYASGKPHIGNTYEAVLADAIARFKRAEGYDVFFQTGTDEHGQKIEEKAAAAGVTPQEFVDQAAGQIKTIWDLMNTSYLRNCTIRATFTKAIMRGFTVLPANPFLQSLSWLTANVRTAAVRLSLRRKRRISSV